MLLTVLTSGAAQLTDQEKQFLAGYQKAYFALTADNLLAATKAGAEMGSAGADLSKSKSLTEARSVFAKLSAETEKLVAGRAGYHVMHCPMLKKDWVQTSDKIANPYGGKEMLMCGEVKT